jgi:hypothetical protein
MNTSKPKWTQIESEQKLGTWRLDGTPWTLVLVAWSPSDMLCPSRLRGRIYKGSEHYRQLSTESVAEMKEIVEDLEIKRRRRLDAWARSCKAPPGRPC